MTNLENIHQPVLLNEILDVFAGFDGRTVVDATLGLGGHTEAILNANPKIEIVGIDQDTAALEIAKERLGRFGSRIKFAHSNFSEISIGLRELGLPSVDGIIADLGVSSLQFDSEERGFSFRFDAPLDMRMDATSGQTAAELLQMLSEEEIANIIYKFGEERASRRIARRIVLKRQNGEPVATTFELVQLIERSVKRSPKDKIHPATRTFQALRIAVNGEIDILEKFLMDAIDLLNKGGKIAIITFHSLEDRIVKHTLQKMAGKCSCPPRMPQCMCGAEKKVEIITRRPIVPDDQETQYNPRSRSAKLRVAVRI